MDNRIEAIRKERGILQDEKAKALLGILPGAEQEILIPKALTI